LHDRELHTQNQPNAGPSRAIFEALEQARIETLGGQHLEGVRDNLHAALEARASRKRFDRDDIPKDDTTMAEAMGLYAREAMTGRPLPASADGIMSVWRDTLEDVAGEKFKGLLEHISDQNSFADQVRDLLRDFEMGEDMSDPEESEDNNEDESSENEDDQNSQDEESASDDQPGQTEVSEADAQEDDSAEAQDMVEAEEIDGESNSDDQEPTYNPNQSPIPNAPPAYHIYTTKHDEVIKAEELCDIEELDRLRGYLDGHMAGLSSVIARLANRLQRRLLAQQQRSWTFDLEEGMLDTARLTRVITDPMSALTFKALRPRHGKVDAPSKIGLQTANRLNRDA